MEILLEAWRKYPYMIEWMAKVYIDMTLDAIGEDTLYLTMNFKRYRPSSPTVCQKADVTTDWAACIATNRGHYRPEMTERD